MDNYGYQPDDNRKPFAITRYGSDNDRPLRNDYFVEVNSRSKVLKNPKFYKRLALLFIILAIILLILLIVVASFYIKALVKPNICTSDECIRSAANLKYSLDLSVDPCTDFYQYTCGRWSEEHPNHGWYPSFSTFATISERIAISSLNFLTSKPNRSEPKPVKQSRDFYKSCMDVEAIDNAGLSVLYKYVEEAGLPLIPSLFTKTNDELLNFKFDWLKADAIIKKMLAMDVLIGLFVDANIYNRSENIMYFGVPGLSCPLPSPLLRQLNKDKRANNYAKDNDDDDDDEDESIDYDQLRLEINENLIRFVLETIVKNVTSEQPKKETLQEAVSVLLNMTYFVDELITNYTVYEAFESKPYLIKTYQTQINDILINNINKDYPTIWEDYLGHIFEGTNVTIDVTQESFYIGDMELEYIPKLLHYVLSTSDAYLELYMWFVTVFAMIMNTSSDVVEYIARQTAPYYSSSNIARSRSLDCSGLVTNFMGMAVSYGIADQTFTHKTKPKVEEMLYNIKHAFVERVNAITWMDKNTKRETLEKSKEMISFIGYPEWLFDEGALDIYYKGIVVANNTYLENMMSFTKDYIPSKFAELRVINERTWQTDPIIVNAFNSFSDNAINVPMAILSFPIYNLGLEVLNYGAIGSVLGHELTHGFDNSGRKHDKFGNYKQWWSNETIETFEQKIQCFIEQYDNFTIDGIDEHIRGQLTLGENLADNGGLSHAYVAYHNYVRRFGSESKLPGFENYTTDQLFFIAFGSIWCETATLQDLKSQILYDEHCPNVLRVKGVLQNSPEFSKAFHCPVGSGMNPRKDKCKIW